MSVKLHLPNRFYYLWEGKSVIEVTGRTVAECLDDLAGIIPLMKKTLSHISRGRWILILRFWSTRKASGRKVWREKCTTATKFISCSEPPDDVEAQTASSAV